MCIYAFRKDPVKYLNHLISIKHKFFDKLTFPICLNFQKKGENFDAVKPVYSHFRVFALNFRNFIKIMIQHLYVVFLHRKMLYLILHLLHLQDLHWQMPLTLLVCVFHTLWPLILPYEGIAPLLLHYSYVSVHALMPHVCLNLFLQTSPL